MSGLAFGTHHGTRHSWLFRKPAALLFYIALVPLLSGCADLAMDYLGKLKEPKVSLAGLALKDLNPLEPTLLVRLRIENPNDLNVKLDGADVALALNGQPVATGISLSPLTLAKLGATDMDVEVKANTLNALRQIMLLEANQAVKYDVAGHLNVLEWLGSLGRIPFNLQGSVDSGALLRGVEGWGKLPR